MRTWLYDPRNDYKGKIFEGEAEIAQAKADGWEEAPYSDMNVHIPFVIVTDKPRRGRKPNAAKTGKVKEGSK